MKISINYQRLFEYCCKHGYLETAQLCRFVCPTIRISTQDFFLSSIRGHLEVAQWLMQIEPSCVDQCEIIFDYVCHHGQLHVAKWLYQIKPSVFASNPNLFKSTCAFGQFEVANWLYEVVPEFALMASQQALELACVNNNIEIAKWLFQINPDMHINRELFENTCIKGNLEIAQWLIEMFPLFDITSNNTHTPFREACIWGNVEIAQWLQSLKPDQYRILGVNERGNLHYEIVHIPMKFNSIPVSTEQLETCFICTEQIANIESCCNHRFCEQCIQSWVAKTPTCPYCRISLENTLFTKLVA